MNSEHKDTPEPVRQPAPPTGAILSVKNLYKSFGDNAVLRGINLEVAQGEVWALIGGNGAGKSTLVKCVMGLHKPDSGEVAIDGRVFKSFSPAQSLAKGVYLVPQEPLLFPNMSVEENILMGMNGSTAALHEKLIRLSSQLGWKLEFSRAARTLSIAEQQLVEILRGLLREARLLILDEPTSALTFDEVNALFKAVEELKRKGIGIIYITHRLSEVFVISTNVAIMRDGQITLHGKAQDFTREMLVEGLLPANASTIKRGKKSSCINRSGAPVFEIKDFSGYGFAGVNLKIYPGEVLGLCGVVGAGRTELAMTVFGRDTALSGSVYLDGENITGISTRAIIKKGINYVPEDRFLNGIFKISPLKDNLSSAVLRFIARFFINFKMERDIADKYIEDFRIKTTGLGQTIGSLSGGNQQKAVIGRALTTTPRLVILDEPTRGIDAAARADIYSIIGELKQKEVAVLLISSDIEEIVELSDRALVMFQGRINHEFVGSEITQDKLVGASFGVGAGGTHA
ncbi:MAG: sugar ABC transporter ATP-binding protein [Spirochaetaceae bacterium]|nr:sugar ABC transporter ATP-binding protein [Spirochaetaceae bacterium]